MSTKLTSALAQVAILFALIIGCTNSVTKKSPNIDEDDEVKIVLQHHIKSITVYQVPFKVGNPQKEQIYQLKTFDENGFKLNRIDYGSSGEVICDVEFKYDTAGNLIENKALNRDKSILFNEARSYLENGKRRELIFHLPDGTYKYRNISTYDSTNNLVELDWYWPDGLKARNKFTYINGNKADDTEYAPDGTFRYKWVYKYDQHNNLIEAVQYYPDSLIVKRIVSEYNAADLLISQSAFTGEDLTEKLIFEYSPKGLLTAKTEYSAMGTIQSRYRFEYQFWN